MSIENDSNQEQGKQSDLFRIEGGGNKLLPFIQVKPPDKASKTSPILSFHRKREVEIPWEKTLRHGGDVNAGAKSIEAFRDYFESSWGFEKPEDFMEWMDEKIGGEGTDKDQNKNYLLGDNNPSWKDGNSFARVKHLENAKQTLISISQSAASTIDNAIKTLKDEAAKLKAAGYTPTASHLASILPVLGSELTEAKNRASKAPRHVAGFIEMITGVVYEWNNQCTILSATRTDIEQAVKKGLEKTTEIETKMLLSPKAYHAQLNSKLDAVTVDRGFVVRHGSGRLYLLIDSADNQLCEDDFLSFIRYRNAWESKIQGVELVFSTQEEAKESYMDLEEIDLRPPYIERSYQRLRIQHEFAMKVKERIAERVNSMIDKMNDSMLDPYELEQLQSKVLSLEIAEYDAAKRIKRLASTAERLGYLLCTEPSSITTDKQVAIINQALNEQLANKPQSQNALSEVAKAVRETLSIKQNSKTQTISVIEETESAEIIKAIDLVKKAIKPDDSSTQNVINAIKNVVSAEAKKAAEIDAVKRQFADSPVDLPPEPGKLYTTYQRTAKWNVVVPIQIPVQIGWWMWGRTAMKTVQLSRPVETIVTGRKEVDTNRDFLEEKRVTLIKDGMQVYVFKKTPMGFVSVDGIPLFQIIDRCNYDEEFRRTCVVMLPVYEESMTGQRLLTKYSVFKRPLPGIVPTIMPRLSLEEFLSYRTAWLETQLGEVVNSINLAPGEERTISITKDYEEETSITRTSTSIFDVNKTETSDLASEMENQARYEQESSKSMEFSAKASGSYCGFSAEASASGGTKSSLKDMNQAISRVAKKAAQSVSSHNKQEVSSSSTAHTKITNKDLTTAKICNINQGRALNLFFYRLYNKYNGGLYLENLRFHVIRSVEVIAGSGVHESRSFSLEQLDSMMDEFKAAQLPFSVSDEDQYTYHILDSIEKLLYEEYMKPLGDKNDSKAIFESESLSKNKFTPAPTTNMDKRESSKIASEKLKYLREALKEATIHCNTPIAPQELLVSVPGLYLDAVVGAQPSTEPYSEDMRKLELRMRQAEVYVKESEGFVNQAKTAVQLSQQQNEGRNCITGLLPGPDQRSLSISLKLPLSNGDWVLLNDDKEIVTTIKCHSQFIIVFSFTESQQWLMSESILTRISLLDKTSGMKISCY